MDNIREDTYFLEKIGEKDVDQHTSLEVNSEHIQQLAKCQFICEPRNEVDI